MKWLIKIIKNNSFKLFAFVTIIMVIYIAAQFVNWPQFEKKFIMSRISQKLDIYIPIGMTAKVDVDATYEYKEEMLHRSGRDFKNIYYILLKAIGIKQQPPELKQAGNLKFKNLDIPELTVPNPRNTDTFSLIKTNLGDAFQSFRQFYGVRIVALNNEKYLVRDGKLTGGSKDVLKWSALIEHTAKKYDVDPALIAAVMEQESGGDAMAVSSSGAIGLMQLMPSTAQFLKINPYDPEQNVDGGARYLSLMLKQFGNEELALAAYNAGPNNVYNNNYVFIPETMNYINNVPRLAAKYRKVIDKPI